MRKVLLYSGGMDSWLIDKLWKPDKKIFFDIGTANSNFELVRVQEDKDVEILKLPLSRFEQAENNYFLPLRNLHFVVYAAHFGDTICLGATGSSTHRDKNEVFAKLTEDLVNYLLEEGNNKYYPVKVVMPFRNMTKTEILAEYLRNGGDIDRCYRETFSCYNPNNDGTPCMNCTSCLSKFTAFYNNGYKFDDETIEKFITGVLSNPGSKTDSLNLALKLKYGNKVICVDFDNTITTSSRAPITGELRTGCKEWLCKLKNSGYRIILFTARVGIDFYNCIELCNLWKLPIDEFIQKPYASAYIDDKAIKFNTWEELVI